MRRTLLVLAALALVVPALAQEAQEKVVAEKRSPEAIAILEKVDAAVKAVSTVRLTGNTVPSGIATGYVSAAEGTAVMSGWNGTTPEKFYIEVATTKLNTDEAVKLTGGGDGDSFFIVDHNTKKAYEDMDPAVLGSGANTMRSIGMIEFVHHAPFDDELNADDVQLLGEETVNGEECYKIEVVYQGAGQSSTWHFSKKDYLPRRRVRQFNVPGQGEGALEINITGIEVSPDLDPKMFKLSLPEGYEQIDDFYP